MPSLTVDVSTAMREALRLYCKSRKITMTDLVVGLLRQHGFDRDDVLEAIADGRIPDIDVRRRTSAQQRDPNVRVREYLEEHGCTSELNIQRNLHINAAETHRGIETVIEAGLAHQKPFDRPVYAHWNAMCKCKVALPASRMVV